MARVPITPCSARSRPDRHALRATPLTSRYQRRSSSKSTLSIKLFARVAFVAAVARWFGGSRDARTHATTSHAEPTGGSRDARNTRKQLELEPAPKELTNGQAIDRREGFRSEAHDRVRGGPMIIDETLPQLRAIMWSRATREVTDEEALALYEANHQWVDRATMTEREARHFDDLVKRLGRGVFLG